MLHSCQVLGIDPALSGGLSDLARSAGRMAHTLTSKWHALSTHVKIWDYDRMMVLSGQELMGMAGFDMGQFSSHGLEYSMLNRFAGNAMTPSVLGGALLSFALCAIPDSSGHPPLRLSSPFVLLNTPLLDDQLSVVSESAASTSSHCSSSSMSCSSSSSSSSSTFSDSDSGSIWVSAKGV